MEATPGPRLEALCALCIQELYASAPHCRRISPVLEPKDAHHYPSKIISAVLAGTHTLEVTDITGRGNGLHLTFKAVTVWQGTDLCAGHVVQMTALGTRPHYPREYTNR